ncbi:ANKR7 protein, partial [Corythaeola cristata]|nr:ANKR7 protein [Corythaeola cristata]
SRTPLHLPCENGHTDVRFPTRNTCQLNTHDSFKKSPLMKAVEHQHRDCVAILLEHGANPGFKDPCGNTALHLAAIIPSESVVELLLEHNADIDAQNMLGYTPLAMAIVERCDDMVKFLL